MKELGASFSITCCAHAVNPKLPYQGRHSSHRFARSIPYRLGVEARQPAVWYSSVSICTIPIRLAPPSIGGPRTSLPIETSFTSDLAITEVLVVHCMSPSEVLRHDPCVSGCATPVRPRGKTQSGSPVVCGRRDSTKAHQSPMCGPQSALHWQPLQKLIEVGACVVIVFWHFGIPESGQKVYSARIPQDARGF